MSSRKRTLSVELSDMRMPYSNGEIPFDTFTETDLVSKEPIRQFKFWFDAICETPEILEPNAMCLSTCTKNGFPSSRMVLLKGFGTDGFKFFTNYESRKGRELEENPRAALLFYWPWPNAPNGKWIKNRQVRIEGNIARLSEAESDDYFHSRPVNSQVAASISRQSQPVHSREDLIERKIEYANTVDQKGIPKPVFWGGFNLKPESIEFWQGNSDRLHDRIRFRKLARGEKVDGVLLHEGEDGWVYERLQP